MNLFQDFIFNWWEIGFLKIALLCLGIVIGAKWPKIFGKKAVIWIMLVLFFIIAIFLAYNNWWQLVVSE